jgi:DNA-directed RNA polymerase sigma subunit (sigma70/sigma32)
LWKWSLQAGKIGVLDGSEKFDNRKGCRFSTYVKYWIRKGMLALLAENSGVTLLSVSLSLSLCNHLLGNLLPMD